MAGRYGAIQSDLSIAAGQSVRRNAGDTAFEAYTPSTGDGLGSDGDKGDITVGGSGTTLTIDNDAVTYAKLQNVAGFSVVGKATTGSGDAADITAADETVLGRTGAGNLAFAQVATGQIANGAVTEAKQTLADNTTNDVSITKHGYAPKAPNDTSKYLRGDGTWATVAATGDGLGTDGDKGDITVGGTGTTLTIDNDAVTYAKIQNVSATNRILGRSTAGAGDIEEITVGGDLSQSGSSFTVVSASDTVAGKIEIAIQSEMEAGTDTTRAVTPGTQHYHPAASKFWVSWTGNSTTILASYNTTSIADTAVGDADVTLATSFSSANWCGQVSTQETGTDGWDADSIQSSGFNAKAAGTCGVLCGVMIDGGTAVGNLTDPDQWNVIGFGDLP